jgi:hypothetical protein
MRTITEKDLKSARKPIQFYLDRELNLALQSRLKEKSLTLSEYLRDLVAQDCQISEPTAKPRKWPLLDWKGKSIKPEEIDPIVYNL